MNNAARPLITCFSLLMLLSLSLLTRVKADNPMPVTFRNNYATLAVGTDGRNLHLIDNKSGTNYCKADSSFFASIKKDGQVFPSTEILRDGERMNVSFGDSGIRAVLRMVSYNHYFVMEVLSVDGNPDELAFVQMPLSLRGSLDEPFSACALALNLKTNVLELPGPGSLLRAMCYPRFGFVGAKAALIACPTGHLRKVMQEVVSRADELPHSSLGGPWALDGSINRGSYLFDFGSINEQTVDDWIAVARSLGMTQIDFHGGSSFRFGDIEPDASIYPRSLDSMKAVVDRIHAAGMQAGLHTYAFCLDKRCKWVSPVPDPRLGFDSVYTLAEDITADSAVIPVLEPTQNVSTITGFFVRNSVTLRIDNEPITFAGASKELPYAFTGCQRGVLGTKRSSHSKGAKVYKLKECFGLFMPDGDSTLFTEVAARTAEVYNYCGFDMMYMDALDSEDIFAGIENGWHYGSKFVFEVVKRLKKPALMEMSTFHHHLWFVRSRMGAWDHPNRGHKQFIDNHVATNHLNKRMFLPSQLGWWNLLTWNGAQREPTYPDVMEYLVCKCLGTDTGFALLQGINPDNIKTSAYLQRLAEITRRYEALRHSGLVPEKVKAELRAPGKEFTLIETPEKKYRLVPIRYAKHKVEGIDRRSNVWKTDNLFDRQPAKIRIEALLTAGAYDAPENPVLLDFSGPVEKHSAKDVSVELQPVIAPEKACVSFAASSRRANAKGAWAMAGAKFSPPLNLGERQAMGVWIHGDGQGEVLNFQVRSPEHMSGGFGEHYVVVDFTGWRYFELIEPEGERYANYTWPYAVPQADWGTVTDDAEASQHWVSGSYHIYRESVNYGAVNSVSVWYNNIPPGKSVSCHLSPVKALPLVNTRLINPAVTISGKRIVFPVEIESGCWLEFNSMTDCKLFGPQGELLCKVTPQGASPVLEPGENKVEFTAATPVGISARANVSIISMGKPIFETRITGIEQGKGSLF